MKTCGHKVLAQGRQCDIELEERKGESSSRHWPNLGSYSLGCTPDIVMVTRQACLWPASPREEPSPLVMSASSSNVVGFAFLAFKSHKAPWLSWNLGSTTLWLNCCPQRPVSQPLQYKRPQKKVVKLVSSKSFCQIGHRCFNFSLQRTCINFCVRG